MANKLEAKTCMTDGPKQPDGRLGWALGCPWPGPRKLPQEAGGLGAPALSDNEGTVGARDRSAPFASSRQSTGAFKSRTRVLVVTRAPASGGQAAWWSKRVEKAIASAAEAGASAATKARGTVQESRQVLGSSARW